MIIRNLTIDDLNEHNKVSSSAFIWKVDPAIDNKLPDATLIGAFDDDGKTLMAEVECNDFKNYFCSGLLGCVGIGGVATKPEFRRMGGVRSIFGEIENRAFDNGWDIGILYPFSTEYYRQFGYENAAHYVSAKIAYKYVASIDRSFDVDIVEGSNVSDIIALYNKIAARTTLSFKRDNAMRFITEPYEKSIYTYMWKNSNGEYRSYASYTVDRARSCVNVREIGFLDREALLGILGFLRCYDGNQEFLCFEKLPVYSPVFDVIPDTAKIERELRDIGSVRIYNFEKVLSLISYPCEHGHFSVEIKDSIPHNSGIYDVEFENGKALITRNSAKAADIVLAAPAASKIMLCGIDGGFEKLQYCSGVGINTESSDFLKVFPHRDPFFWDGF